MKGRYFFVCFWLLVLGIVRVDCHLRHKLRNILARDYTPTQNIPVQQGSFEVYQGSMDQLGSFNAEWVCTNSKNNNKLIIGSDQMESIRRVNQYPAQNGNAWNGPVYTPPQEYYPPQQSPGNQGISYQPETPKQYYPSQQAPQQGHQNSPQPLPQNPPYGQEQSKPGSAAVTQTSTYENSPSTADSSFAFNNFDWNAYVTVKPVRTPAEEKEIVYTGEGILQPRVNN